MSIEGVRMAGMISRRALPARGPVLGVASLVLVLVLSACGSSSLDGGTGTTPGTTASAGCAGDAGLSAPAYSPQQIRVAYGVDALCRVGYTGRGQTVVVIDSFGSPALQQD